jgi:2-polyprenyl-3-methyl-5-hydroxy-6-metoxy-1,4-benzoquinol methylase
MPLYRFVGNRVTTIVENLLLGCRFTEMHSGLRAYTRECLLHLPFLRYTDDFAFDSQLLVDAVTGGQRVVEVPIPTRYTAESSSISIARSVRYVATSVAYSAASAARRGRRGRRWPVTFAGNRAGPVHPTSAPAHGKCALCGSDDLGLLYPSNVGVTPIDTREFSCTSGVLAKHDDIVCCRRCGMVSSQPTTDSAERATQYEGVVDDVYFDEEVARRELFRWVLDRMQGYALSGRRLLEVGSNVGVFLDVARSSGWTAHGVEPSRWAVEEGRRRFGVDLRQGSIEALDDEDPVDAIVMLDVFEHLTHPAAVLEQLHGRLAAEGLLVLTTVNVSSLHARVRRGSWPWFIRPHLHYFTPETLDAMLARTGYKLVEWAVVPRWFHLSYVAERARRSHGSVVEAVTRASQIADPRVPVGWLGDVVLAIARPAQPPLARAGDDPAVSRATDPASG